MKFLGIDQSFTSTGWCLFEDDVLLKYGIVTSSKNDNIFDRMFHVSCMVEEIASKHKVSGVALEGLPFMSRSNVTRDLAGLQAVIVTNLIQFELDTDLFIIPPTTVKKLATGSGKADKVEMFEALPDEIRKQFEKTPKTKGRYDITDAYWIGVEGIKRYNKVVKDEC